MLIRNLLQNSVPYGAYHWLSSITHRNWNPPTYGTCNEAGTFHIEHDAGFFSNCSVTLFEIARSKKIVKKIDASDSFSWYKENEKEDVWHNYFSLPILRKINSYGYWGETLLHHNKYRKLNIKCIEQLLDSYFHPSDFVLSRQMDLLKKYDIDLEKTLAINFRGTDKIKEIAPMSVQKWIKITQKKLTELHPATRVLIQTDQQQVREQFTEEFGSKSFYFNEMPVTQGDKAIHEILAPDKRKDFSIDLLATTLILSNCNSVITHTGNVAFWTVLFRRNTVGLIQI